MASLVCENIFYESITILIIYWIYMRYTSCIPAQTQTNTLWAKHIFNWWDTAPFIGQIIYETGVRKVFGIQDRLFDFAREIVIALITYDTLRQDVFRVAKRLRNDMFDAHGARRIIFAEYTVHTPLARKVSFTTDTFHSLFSPPFQPIVPDSVLCACVGRVRFDLEEAQGEHGRAAH